MHEADFILRDDDWGFYGKSVTRAHVRYKRELGESPEQAVEVFRQCRRRRIDDQTPVFLNCALGKLAGKVKLVFNIEKKLHFGHGAT